jgi:hypothetical protein
MLNGEIVSDPAPASCGFGKRSENPIIQVEVNGEEMVQLYGEEIRQYLKMKGQAEVTAPDTDMGIQVRGLEGLGGGGQMERVDIPPTVIPAQ